MGDASEWRREAFFKAYRRKPFVGFVGTTNTIEILERRDSLICRLTSSAARFNIGMLAAFALTLSAWLWFYGWRATQELPGFVVPVVVLFAIFSWWGLGWMLWRDHRIVVPRAQRGLLFFTTRGGRAFFRLSGDELQGFETGECWHQPSEGEPIRNILLFAVTLQGRRVALCVSTEENLVLEFEQKLIALTGAPDSAR